MAVDFHEITAPVPVLEDVKARYDRISEQLAVAPSAQSAIGPVEDWDHLRRELDTWEALTNLRFNQDTANPGYKQARDYCDELRPKLTEQDVRIKRQLVQAPYRAELEKQLGPQALALWEADILTYDPAIEQEMVREAKLAAEYQELTASARLTFHGQEENLSGITRYLEDSDRQTRHDADAIRWGWFAENGQALDRIFDEQVRLRDEMARKLGFPGYIELAYKRMKRIDYDRRDVERYRDEVRRHVVPLGEEIRRRQAQTLGVDRLMAWDLAVHDPAGNPAPQGDHDWMLDRAQEMFDGLGSGLDNFFRLMRDGHLLDLKNRPTKAGGGFCTSFPTVGVPFIFANFNGTKGDVEVFTHEMGHAFQGYQSRQQPLIDYLWPTMESCEIHSMSLEFLTWPQMEKFFGPGAERFRRIHLAQSLLFLPYGVAVDHFQHLVYQEPSATPAQRHAMWRQMEQMYLPWIDWGDLAWPAQGGRWQAQRHIYLHPFYYIDYTLAQTCALQYWVRAERDFAEAMSSYVALCRRGGEAPFQELCRGAGLVSPFQSGCLKDVVEQARTALFS